MHGCWDKNIYYYKNISICLITYFGVGYHGMSFMRPIFQNLKTFGNFYFIAPS